MSDAFQHLMFDLDMDISKFTTSVSQVETAIKNVSAGRKLAIGDEFIRLSATVDKLKQSLANINSVSIKPLEKSIADPAKQSRIALTSLSQVAQDLPFGFIGIQNNLPILLQSFQHLTESTKTTGGALKALGQSMLGPGGVFLAFSIVTAAITGAIQKYGSLSNAIQALTSNNSALFLSQKSLNEELAKNVGNTRAENVEANALLKILNDLSAPIENRKAAYVELNKLSSTYTAGLKDENDLSETAIGIINRNAEARKHLLILKARESAINAELNKNAAEAFKLELERPKIIANLVKEQEKYNASISKVGTSDFGGDLLKYRNLSQGLSDATIAYNDNVNAGIKLAEVDRSLVDTLDPIITSISEVDYGFKKLTDTQKEQQSQSDKDSKKRDKQYEKDLKFIEAVIKYYERLGKFVPNVDISGIQKAFFEISNQIKGFNISNRVKLNVEVAQGEMDVALRNIQMKAEKGVYKPANFVQTNQPGSVSEGDIEAANKFSKSVKRYKQELGEFNKMAAQNHMTMGELAKSFEDTQKKLNSAFFTPLTSMFTTFLTTGKFTFKSLGDAIKKMIAEVAAKIIVTGILKSLSAIMNPEGAQANKLQNPNYNGNGGGGNWIANAAKILGGALGGQMNPNFAGVTGGGSEMRGQVNMVLRGTDLVGSINRTNSVINRIG